MTPEVIRELVFKAEQAGSPLYQPLALAELADVKSRRGQQTFREYVAILEELCRQRVEPLTVLDIGANAGFFSIRMAEAFPYSHVTAVEPDDTCIAFFRAQLALRPHLSNIRLWSGVEPKFLYEPFDVCLMLNVHHWIRLKKGEAYTSSLLRDLAQTTRRFFFQTAHDESLAHDPGTGEDIRDRTLLNEREVHDYLALHGFKQPRTLLRSFEHPRFLVYAEGRL